MTKIIASDMDGTFLDSDKNYDVERFNEQLAFMAQKDIKFVAASGNRYKHLKKIFDPAIKKGHEISYVASNGAATYHRDELINTEFLTREQIQKVVTWNAKENTKDENLVVLSGLNMSYVSNHATPSIIKLIKMWYHDITQVEKFNSIADDILEVTFIWENEDVANQVRKLREYFGEEVHSTGSGFGNVDILAPNTNKATGMQHLQDIWNVSDEDVIAFGDNENDIEMLLKYPNSYVMKNAEQFMLDAIPNHTRLTNEENGVIDTIDKILSDI